MFMFGAYSQVSGLLLGNLRELKCFAFFGFLRVASVLVGSRNLAGGNAEVLGTADPPVSSVSLVGRNRRIKIH